MEITTDQVKQLREETGVSVMQCRKALEEASGDLEKAKIMLYKISKQAADKKADRALGSGAIASYVHGTGTVGVMLELLCETDFVARNEDFKILARELAMHVAAMAPLYAKMSDVPEAELNKAKELFKSEIDPKKPQDIQDKILEGRLQSYFAEQVLSEQGFIKNPETKISTMIEQAVQKFGERTEIGRFVRFSIS